MNKDARVAIVTGNISLAAVVPPIVGSIHLKAAGPHRPSSSATPDLWVAVRKRRKKGLSTPPSEVDPDDIDWDELSDQDWSDWKVAKEKFAIYNYENRQYAVQSKHTRNGDEVTKEKTEAWKDDLEDIIKEQYIVISPFIEERDSHERYEILPVREIFLEDLELNPYGVYQEVSWVLDLHEHVANCPDETALPIEIEYFLYGEVGASNKMREWCWELDELLLNGFHHVSFLATDLQEHLAKCPDPENETAYKINNTINAWESQGVDFYKKEFDGDQVRNLLLHIAKTDHKMREFSFKVLFTLMQEMGFRKYRTIDRSKLAETIGSYHPNVSKVIWHLTEINVLEEGPLKGKRKTHRLNGNLPPKKKDEGLTTVFYDPKYWDPTNEDEENE
ncbi:hypothetical protein [Yunchengibacter salinarum]|uniref:hypothetical protein n=1 Tax=Yunchengibacter salinarum TaxID=3133399 RepID=UPI0035B65B4D